MKNREEIEKILKSAREYAERGAMYGNTKDDREQYSIAMTVFECLIHALETMKY